MSTTEFSDEEELTPKPLRIVKQRSLNFQTPLNPWRTHARKPALLPRDIPETVLQAHPLDDKISFSDSFDHSALKDSTQQSALEPAAAILSADHKSSPSSSGSPNETSVSTHRGAAEKARSTRLYDKMQLDSNASRIDDMDSLHESAFDTYSQHGSCDRDNSSYARIGTSAYNAPYGGSTALQGGHLYHSESPDAQELSAGPGIRTSPSYSDLSTIETFKDEHRTSQRSSSSRFVSQPGNTLVHETSCSTPPSAGRVLDVNQSHSNRTPLPELSFPVKGQLHNLRDGSGLFASPRGNPHALDSSHIGNTPIQQYSSSEDFDITDTNLESGFASRTSPFDGKTLILNSSKGKIITHQERPRVVPRPSLDTSRSQQSGSRETTAASQPIALPQTAIRDTRKDVSLVHGLRGGLSYDLSTAERDARGSDNSKVGIPRERENNSINETVTPVKTRPRNQGKNNTQMTQDSKLDDIIASFPSPSTRFSPAQKLFQVQPNAEDLTAASREQKRVAGANVVLIPEREGVYRSELHNGRSFYVAVEVRSTSEVPSSGGVIHEIHRNCDIAVVVDNSIFSSPMTLISSCDLVGSIASRLNSNRDRLALFETSRLQGNVLRPFELLRLGKTTVQQLKLVLGTIGSSQTVPEADYLSVAIEQAVQHMTQYTGNSIAQSKGTKENRHVVVLTANLAALPSYPASYRQVVLHAISSGTVPWKDTFFTANNGWYIYDLSGSLSSPETVLLARQRAVQSNLDKLLLNLRCLPKDPELTNFRVSLAAGSHFIIERIMGPARFKCLARGEVQRIMVKLRMKQGINVSPQKESLSILGARLRYTNRGLPVGTVCEATSAAKLTVLRKRVSTISVDTIFTTDDRMGRSHGERNLQVSNYLIYQIATSDAPDKAIRLLREIYKSDAESTIVKPYLQMVVKELRYHQRVLPSLAAAGND